MAWWELRIYRGAGSLYRTYEYTRLYDKLQTVVCSVGNLKLIIHANDKCFVLDGIAVMCFPVVTQQEIQ
jgi:protein associated with RNAse G/E